LRELLDGALDSVREHVRFSRQETATGALASGTDARNSWKVRHFVVK
jgi:hypothetical protein